MKLYHVVDEEESSEAFVIAGSEIEACIKLIGSGWLPVECAPNKSMDERLNIKEIEDGIVIVRANLQIG